MKLKITSRYYRYYYHIETNEKFINLLAKYNEIRTRHYFSSLVQKISNYLIKPIDKELLQVIQDIKSTGYLSNWALNNKQITYATFITQKDLVQFRKKSATKERLTEYIAEQSKTHIPNFDSILYIPRSRLLLYLKNP